MIPEEAIEAAARAIVGEFSYEENAPYMAKLAIEAALPILLSHEREETRLAHLDAMVNRETKREELARVWDEAASSIVDEHGNRLIPYENTNPYRSQA